MPYVSVAIISHNYGHYLQEAIDSVLAQTTPAHEIILIDSASTDDTWEQSQRFCQENKDYSCYQNPGGHIWDARKLAAERCNPACEWILFLDADDILPPTYIEECLKVAQAQDNEHDAAIIYSDLQRFDQEEGLSIHFPENLDRANYIHAGSLVRREAIITTDSLRPVEALPPMRTSDWFLWRRVLTNGWRAYKQDKAPYQYRIHQKNMTTSHRYDSYAEIAHYQHSPLTIVCALSHRPWKNDLLRWLIDQPKKQETSIILIDDSRDTICSFMLQDILAEYTDVQIIRVPESQIDPSTIRDYSEQGRAVDQRMCYLYGQIVNRIHTPFTLFVEDDVRPPLDVAQKLLEVMEPWVDSVTGVYSNRHYPEEFLLLDLNGNPIPHDYKPFFDVEPCLSSGFGCLLVRSDTLTVPFRSSPHGGWYDLRFFVDRGLQHLVHWGVHCGHAEIAAPWEDTADRVTLDDAIIQYHTRQKEKRKNLR